MHRRDESQARRAILRQRCVAALRSAHSGDATRDATTLLTLTDRPKPVAPSSSLGAKIKVQIAFRKHALSIAAAAKELHANPKVPTLTTLTCRLYTSAHRAA